MTQQQLLNTFFEGVLASGTLDNPLSNSVVMNANNRNSKFVLDMYEKVSVMASKDGKVDREQAATALVKLATKKHLSTTPLYMTVSTYNDTQRRNKKRQVHLTQLA